MASELERLMTAEELAVYLGVTLRTISEWKATSYGPRRVRVGRRVFFRISDVNDWIARQAEVAP